MFTHVLATTDGSAFARATLGYLPSLVGIAGRVTVLEVIDDPSRLLAKTAAGFEFAVSDALGLGLIDEVIAGERQAAEVHLADARRDLEAAGLTDIETLIVQGIPGPAIVDEAKRRGVDVVAMATHGRSGITRAVLGSVASHVLHHLEDIPVLLIHPHTQPDAPR